MKKEIIENIYNKIYCKVPHVETPPIKTPSVNIFLNNSVFSKPKNNSW